MRKQSFLLPLGALFLVPLLASAQTAFDGTWKVDMSKVAFPKKPDVFLLQNGMYECQTCSPPYKVKADGTDQPVTGHPYFDSVAITVVNDHEIQETDKKGGKTVTTSTTTASADGKMVTFSFTDTSDTNGGPAVTGKGEAVLVTKGPAGSHAISGSWRTSKIEGMSDNAITWTYKTSGDSITMTNPTGQSYTAKLDGTETPMMGDPGISSVMVKMVGKDTLIETDKRDGKVIGVMTLTAEPGGRMAKAVYDDKLQNRSTTYSAVKQ